MGEVVIVPGETEGFVELARTKSGRLFRKHLLSTGTLRHPVTGEDVAVTDDFLTSLQRNFDAGVCDTVAVPLANDRNQHTEDPDRNIGEVIGTEVKDGKFYAVLDVRDADRADKLGKTYLGASAMLHLDYTDTKSGSKVGPTLLHACVTNRPYVTGLENYEEIVAATSDTSGDDAVLLVAETATVAPPAETGTSSASTTESAPTTEETTMGEQTATQEPTTPSLEDLLTTLKNEHNIDVAGLQAQAAQGAQAAALSQTLVKALGDAGVVKLTGADTETVSTEDVVGAVAELANSNTALTDRVHKLERADAEHAVDALIGEGKVMPAQRAGFVELKLTNPDMFAALVPAEPIIKLTNESGVTPPAADNHVKDVDAEIARLTELMAAK